MSEQKSVNTQHRLIVDIKIVYTLKMNYKQNNKNYINLVTIKLHRNLFFLDNFLKYSHHRQRPTAGYRPLKLSETGNLVYIPTVITLVENGTASVLCSINKLDEQPCKFTL